MRFLGEAREIFNIKPISSTEMQKLINECANVYAGRPYWLGDDIKTINFAKALCSETARLAMLDIEITLEGGARAKYLQEKIDVIKQKKLREWVEYGTGWGSIILKPNGKSIDLITPDRFSITAVENGEITGCVFQDTRRTHDGNHFYNRLEYHSRENGRYTIQNRTYYSDSEGSLGKPISIKETPWADLSEEVTVDNAEGNMFAFFKMPHANNVDIDSPLGLPIIADCIEELKDLDIAYSRNALEIDQSKRTILLDSDKLLMNGSKKKDINIDQTKRRMELPDFVKIVEGDGNSTVYQEINPLIQTDARLVGINALLSQIGYKCGFSNGYFVFNEQMGIQTATGVEANQQRTIQYIKDVRDQLQSCIDQLIYALNAFADAYGLAPIGDYEIAYKFGDITYNVEEDRARWWSYVQAGKVSAWRFFVKFEGMTEEEAKEMTAEATQEIMAMNAFPMME